MGFGYIADQAFLSWTSFTKSLFTYSSHGLQEPWMFSQRPCLHRLILRSHKPDLSTVNLCYFSVYLPLVSHNLHTIERNSLAEILISFPVFFVDQIGHRYAFYCWVGKKKKWDQGQNTVEVKIATSKGIQDTRWHPLRDVTSSEKETLGGSIFVLRLSSLRTISFFSVSCVSQHPQGGLAFLTDSGHLDWWVWLTSS